MWTQRHSAERWGGPPAAPIANGTGETRIEDMDAERVAWPLKPKFSSARMVLIALGKSFLPPPYAPMEDGEQSRVDAYREA